MEDAHPDRSTTHPKSTHDRITELDDIDSSVARLLQSAGKAIQTLSSDSPASNLSAAKSQFIDSVITYFTTLSSIDVRLRRQVYALEEAGLIVEGNARDAKRGAASGRPGGAGLVGGAGGHLDVGWLNGRGGQVERDMKKEVWKRARQFVQRLVEEREAHAIDGASNDDHMADDHEQEADVDKKDGD